MTTQKYEFDSFTATMIAEGVEEPQSQEHFLAAWQYLIDTGLAWKLQGFFGRTAANLIEQNLCHRAGKGGAS